MPKFPTEFTLNPVTALSSGLRSNSAPILKSEDLTALKTIAAAVVEEFEPVQPTEWMWCNILAFSFFRIHRVWNLSAAVSEREQTHGTLFHSIELDELRPAIEGTIQSIHADMMTLEDTFRRLSGDSPTIPLQALLQVFRYIQGRDYCPNPSSLHKALSEALETLNDTTPKEALKEAVESILEGLRGVIAENRQSILEIERLRERLSSTSIATAAIHRDSDRLMAQEMKLIQNIERSQANLYRLAKMRGCTKP
jgi:regulator of replication initiation timing